MGKIWHDSCNTKIQLVKKKYEIKTQEYEMDRKGEKMKTKKWYSSFQTSIEGLSTNIGEREREKEQCKGEI